MKAKISIKYNLAYQEGTPPKIEEEIKKRMKMIDARFIGSGFNNETSIRDLEYELNIKEKKIN